MSALVDTNVIRELARQRPDPGVLEWAATQTAMTLSVVTVEEVYFGLSWRPKPRIVAWFESFLSSNCLILPVTDEIARGAGVLRGRLAASGKVRTQADMLIAATALVHRQTLVTRNIADFEGCGIALLDPFGRF